MVPWDLEEGAVFERTGTLLTDPDPVSGIFDQTSLESSGHLFSFAVVAQMVLTDMVEGRLLCLSQLSELSELDG